MDLQSIISSIEGLLEFAFIINLIKTVILIVFLISVPKFLNDISHTLRMMYRYGIKTEKPVPSSPVYDNDKDDSNSQYWYIK